jgi:hypothetical protein
MFITEFIKSQTWAGGSAFASQVKFVFPEIKPKNSPLCSAGHSGSSVKERKTVTIIINK